MTTNELTGPALDRAVAKCLGITQMEWSDDNGGYDSFSPSTDWAQGGPIIEREWLQVTPWPNESDEDMRWHCVQHDTPVQCHAYGPTPLIAAMRCFVASRLGDNIEIPAELS